MAEGKGLGGWREGRGVCGGRKGAEEEGMQSALRARRRRREITALRSRRGEEIVVGEIAEESTAQEDREGVRGNTNSGSEKTCPTDRRRKRERGDSAFACAGSFVE